MADAFGNYNLNLSVDDELIDIPASSYNFTICDSIHSIYPKMNMVISDPKGRLNEYMSFINGTKVTIGIGRTDTKQLTCSYRVVENSVPQQYNQNGIAGDINLSLIHDWQYYQSKKCVAYDNNISNIIKDLIKEYRFDNVDIDNTLNPGLWYQPYLKDDEFIHDILLPFAYTTNANKTPFFFFIGCDNTFNFKNLSILKQQTPIKEYSYANGGMIQNFSNLNINTVNFLQESNENLESTYRRILYSFNENGEIESDNEHYISDYPSNEIDAIPIRIKQNNITKVNNIIDDDIYSTEWKNNRLGYEVSDLNNEYFVDKIFITVNFDYRLRAGRMIKATFPIHDDEGNQIDSLRHSNYYLVETCYHKWDGNKAYTILICSKQTVKLTETYRNKDLIVGR